MALNTSRGWTTQDYFDPFPGIAAGQASARLASENTARRDAAKERAVNAAVEDQRYREGVTERKDIRTENDRRYREEQAMRQADALARMGVEPVLRPDGTTDWQATGKAAILKQEIGKQAQSLGVMHAWQGGPTSFTQEEYALTQTPEYQQAYRMAAAEKAQRDAQYAAQLEQIGARGKAQLDVAGQRGPSAYITRDLPGGGNVRIPVSPEDAMQMGAPSGDGSAAAKNDAAIESEIQKMDRLISSGSGVDFEIDANGMPKITKSHYFNAASPSNKKSVDDLRAKLVGMKKGGAVTTDTARREIIRDRDEFFKK